MVDEENTERYVPTPAYHGTMTVGSGAESQSPSLSNQEEETEKRFSNLLSPAQVPSRPVSSTSMSTPSHLMEVSYSKEEEEVPAAAPAVTIPAPSPSLSPTPAPTGGLSTPSHLLSDDTYKEDDKPVVTTPVESKPVTPATVPPPPAATSSMSTPSHLASDEVFKNEKMKHPANEVDDVEEIIRQPEEPAKTYAMPPGAVVVGFYPNTETSAGLKSSKMVDPTSAVQKSPYTPAQQPQYLQPNNKAENQPNVTRKNPNCCEGIVIGIVYVIQFIIEAIVTIVCCPCACLLGCCSKEQPQPTNYVYNSQSITVDGHTQTRSTVTYY